MKTIEYFLKRFRRGSCGTVTLKAATGSSALVLTACGGGSDDTGFHVKGFPSFYVGPSSNFVAPTVSDPNFAVLQPIYSDPYWVASLEMDQWNVHITPMLEDFDRGIYYTFLEMPPEYDTFGLTGWEPATEKMKTATREILPKIEKILDITFIESNETNTTNVISVSISNQATTAGFSYFPNNFFEIGMDVFIAKEYASPSFSSELITNYDYEVLVHEIGHALGLKHPFEPNGVNTATLNTFEDNTHNTAMSYDEDTATFSGTLRSLDWMTLTKFYGVKSTYNAGNDTYEFSNLGGIFILDGAGVDTIIAYATSQDVTIDLRPGAHRHLGSKSSYITAANQLTISHGSDIENVITGHGDDTVIGTDVDNLISTGTGSDTIFAGHGADTIKSGTGSDRIDLSEAVQSRDTVMLDAPSADLEIDTIYGFMLGTLGDIFETSTILNSDLELFPLVESGSAPTANFSGGILRLIGSNLSNAMDLSNAFQVGGSFDTLSMDTGANALIISANSQATGEDQSIFAAKSNDAEISVTQVAILQGNALDIDQWHIDNFSILV